MRASIRLSKLHRWSLYFIWLVISFSGLYFSWSQDWLMQEPSDISVNTLKIHGIFATLMLLVIGSLITTHIKLSLNLKRNLLTGLSILSLMLILAFTGTGLYYSPENWHENVKWIHIVVGIFSIAMLPVHIVIGKWISRKRIRILSKQIHMDGV